MPFTLGTTITGLPTNFSTQVQDTGQNDNVTANQTLFDYRERYINTVDSASHNNDQVPLNFNGGNLVVGGLPRGEYDAATTYQQNHAVRVGDQWFVSLTNANTGNDPETSAANWRPTIVDHSRGELVMLTNEGFQAAMGTQVKIRFNNTGSNWDMFNTVLRTAGALRIDQAGRVRLDELVIYNHNTNQTPYFRDLSATAFTTGTYAGTITLDGQNNPMGWYLDQSLSRTNSDANGNFLDNGGLLPRDAFILRRGVLVADGGGADRNNHVILANLDARENFNANDLLAANGSGGSANTLANSRVTEIRNSADGLDFNITPRFPTGNGPQGAGQALVTRQMNFNVQDDDDMPMQGVTLRIPVIGGTDILGAGATQQTFNAIIGSNNLAADSQFMSIDDAAIDATSAADGTFPLQLMHLGYWQTQTQNADGITRRVANGANYYQRHGNQTTAFFSRYGSIPGGSMAVQLNGAVGAGAATFTLLEDATVNGIAEPAAADINFTEGDGGTVNLDVLTINANRTLDECWGAIRSFQVTETVTGDGRTAFNQGVNAGNIDVGNRSLEVTRAGGTAVGVHLEQGTVYTGFSNMVNHRAEGTITYNIDQTGFTFFDTANPPPTIVIDGGDMNGTLRLPPGNYTIQNCEVGNLVVVRDPGSAAGTVTLTLTNVTTNEGDIDVTDPDVNITVTVIFDGGAPGIAGFESRIQLYPLTGTNTLAEQTTDNVLDVTGDPGSGATYPFTIDSSNTDYAAALVQGARFVMVYTRPGFDNIRQVVGPLVAGQNDVDFAPVANVLANATAATQLVGATMTSVYNRTTTPGRIEYTLSQGPGNPPTNVQTNNLFEQAKSSVGVGEFVAKNDFIQPVQHTNSTNTYLFSDDDDTDEDFRLIGARDGALIQHNIGFVGTIDAGGNSGSNPVGPAKIADINSTVDGILTEVDEQSIYEVVSVLNSDWSTFATQGQAAGGAVADNVMVGDFIWTTDDQDITTFGTVQLRARLESVLLGQQVDAATYGDVDSIVTANRNAVLGNMQAQTTQIREIVSEELAEGTLTNIGRT